MIRRLKKDVAPELPPIQIIERTFKLSEVERKLYKQIHQEVIFEIKPEDITGFVPVIISITPLTDIFPLLGLNKNDVQKIQQAQNPVTQSRGNRHLSETHQ